jgi:predicted RNA-binding Zn ribbon-like protein
VLDELLRARAVEVLPSQKIRAKAAMAVDRGMSAQVVKAFGDHATELLTTMLLNMREPESAQFIASVSGSTVIPNSLPLFRKELSSKGAAFLADIQESLTQESSKGRAKLPTLSVTIFCHESIQKKGNKKTSSNKRRNFRRNC